MYEPNKRPMNEGALPAANCLSQQATATCRSAGRKQHYERQPAITRERTRACMAATVSVLAVMVGLLGMGPDASAQSAAEANAPRGAATSFQGQAAQLGVKSCANLFAGLGNILAHGATYTSQAHVGNESADPTAQAVVGMQYDTPAYKAQAAGVVFTAPTKSGCEGQLVRVAPFPQSCPDVVRLLPQGSSLASMLSGTPLYTLGGNQGQALLVSSGNSCVVVTVASAMERR